MTKLEKVKELIQLFENMRSFEFYYKKVCIIKVEKTGFYENVKYKFNLSDGSVIVIDVSKEDFQNG